MTNAAESERDFVSRQEYDALAAQLLSAQQEIARLAQQLLNMRKQLFGRKSEKLDLNQLGLFGSTEIAASEPEPVEVDKHSRRKPTGRKPLPENVPHEKVEHFPAETHCDCCGAELTRIGEEITEQLEFIPSKLIVIDHVKVKLACSSCKNAGVKTGVLPPEVQPIERCRAGVGLLVYIIVSKFCDHLPLNRLEAMFAREGVPIARQRMWDWLEAIADQLQALYRALLAEILTIYYLQADETTIKVQDEELEGKLHTGYFWAVHAPPNLIYYRYDASRASEVPEKLFASYCGFVQTDLYAGYNPIYLPQACTRLGCFAHVRRKFIDADAAKNKEANQILKLIAELYKVESDAKRLTPEARQQLRQKKAVPLLDELFQKIQALNDRLLPQHPLKEATAYALKQQDDLRRYVTDGNFQIDNNAIERQMRPIAVGRKNYLFAGSDTGASVAAIFYSLINTCKLNGVNPRDYLTDVIRRLPTHPRGQLAELLPHRWQPLQPKTV
jgi:transposase